MKLEKEQIEQIKKDAAENWNKDLKVAAAAHVHGANVVTRCGGVPAFADADLIDDLAKQAAAKAKK